MGKTYVKLLFRGVKDSFARFMSILAIVAVGTGFLGGLLATTPDMKLTVDEYYDEYYMFDMYVKGSAGLTKDDVSAVSCLDIVKTAMPAKVTDLVMENEDGSCVARIYGVDFSKYGTEEFLNNFEILEGRLPESSSECVVAVPNEYSSEHKIGEMLTISEENKDYAKRRDTYLEDTVEIVGLIQQPQYMSINKEPSTVGTGEVSVIAYVQDDFYTLDVYTDIYLTLNGVRELDTFSDLYEEKIEEAAEELKKLGIERSDIRYSEIISEASDQLNDAKEEYSKAEKDAVQKLRDSREELDDAWQKLNSAKDEIENGKKELSDAKNEIVNGRVQLQSAKNDYYRGLDKIASAKTELDNGHREIERRKAEIAAGRVELDEARAEIASGKEQLAQYEGIIKGAAAAYDTVESSLENTQRRLEEAKENAEDPLVQESINYLEQQVANLKTELEKLGSQIKKYEQEYNENLKKLETAENECDAAEAKLNAAESIIAENEKKLADGEAEIAQNESFMASAWTQIKENEKKLLSAEALIAENEKKLEDGEKEIAENEAKLTDAEKEYYEGKEKAEAELSDAREKINDAQKEIDMLAEAEWYIFDRGDTVSYVNYESDSEKVSAISKIFPVFFFLVAALVALTTMTRMIEEERTQIGTLKAIGYSNNIIKLYYIGYSVLASLIGGIIGIAAGFKTLPVIISNAYSMMYAIPTAQTPFHWNYAFVIVPVAVFCTTAATVAAVGSQLREKPSMLMQQRAPVAGKRILLENIPLIWKRLKFTHKVTARNIFRYKKRLLMTVIGIAGCSALLVAAFGVRDSIRDIVGKQYGEIYKYNMTVYLNEPEAVQNDSILNNFFESSDYIENYAEMHYETGSAEADGESVSTYIYVPRYSYQLKEQFTLRERKSGQPIEFYEDSVILTEKMCEKLEVSVGDTVNIKNGDGRTAEFKITGIAENYIQSYVFMSASTYEESFGAVPEYTLVLADLKAEYEEQKDEISKIILKSDGILLLQFASAIKTSFENSVENIDYIVLVLIFAAGLLAIIVMYNLTNINICERKKELATIKVLGFHREEVAGYIYRETTILSLIGTAAGFVLGIWLHKFVIKYAEVDALMFGRDIRWTSFLYAGLVTLAFTALVDVLMYKKLVKINMVESMKANE